MGFLCLILCLIYLTNFFGEYIIVKNLQRITTVAALMMKRNIFWVLVGFILSFSIAGFFLLNPEILDNGYEQVLDESTESKLKGRSKQQIPSQETNKFLPPGEIETETKDVEVQYQKLEDILIDWPENAEWPVNWEDLTALPPEEYYKLPQETRLAIARAFYASYGLELPPAGHHYAQNNETGEWELLPNNEPIVTIHWRGNNYGQLHQLTDEEYERYKALHRIATNPEDVASHLIGGGRLSQYLAYPLAACELAKKWYDELHEKTRGPAPSATSSSFYDREYTEADEERELRLIREAIDAVTPQPRDASVDDTILNQILDEIEIELGITIERETQAEKHSRRDYERMLSRIANAPLR